MANGSKYEMVAYPDGTRVRRDQVEELHRSLGALAGELETLPASRDVIGTHRTLAEVLDLFPLPKADPSGEAKLG